MKVDVNMSNEDRFQVGSWWASSPDYVLAALTAQLRSAATIWPELESFRIGTIDPKQVFPEMPDPTTLPDNDRNTP